MRVHFFLASAPEWAVILTPLMFYLLYLGLSVNRRRRPVVMSGMRSLAGLIFALSGFLLVGPFTWILHPLRLEGMWYWFFYANYVLTLGLVAAYFLLRQRNVLVVYNIAPDDFAQTLQESLDQTPIPFIATPGRIAFAEGKLVLDIETMALLHNVTLRWHGQEEELRETIETALKAKLAEVEAGYNPACYFLTFAGAFLFLFIFFALALQWLPEA